MARASELVREIAIDGSFHGLNHSFGRSRRWLFKVTWLLTCVAATLCFAHFAIVSFHEILIEKPTVTDMHYVTHSQLQFPQVIVCPIQPNQTQMDSYNAPSAQRLIAFLAALSQNPMFGGLRHDLRKSLTETLQKYPNLETHWQNLFKEGNPDEATQQIYGLYKP